MKMVREVEPKQTPQVSKQANPSESGQHVDTLFSPRFKSVAAMAGWDEDALIIATLVVEDTPDRESKHKKRSDLIFKTPTSTTSRRKRRAQRTPVSIPIAPLNLEEEETSKQESDRESVEQRLIDVNEEKKTQVNEATEQPPGVSCSSPASHYMDKLREALSCAICLDICFEPSTTPCGHSFCRKCLRSAADKCGKTCPKCRQLISNGRSYTVNTVLWNTIQLLFPKEIESRKAARALNSREVEHQTPESGSSSSRSIRPQMTPTRHARVRRRGMMSQDEDAALALRLQREDLSLLVSTDTSMRRRRGTPGQDEDAALALRLQREEFMESFRGTHQQTRTSLSLARANLRAMASRAIKASSLLTLLLVTSNAMNTISSYCNQVFLS
ncbi:putative E3 ubiquitin-protein ligase RING1a [Durio zibethinus]|uniref:RING-type E3 ubiquitin transferase n=1 Tax=Durio zibethinus TaxID=66656 RepID=A0A6P5ZHN9_DURZI|nr:putative E3 ubiquitin-protein ligase RING1a [Durio zibethinus]